MDWSVDGPHEKNILLMVQKSGENHHLLSMKLYEKMGYSPYQLVTAGFLNHHANSTRCKDPSNSPTQISAKSGVPFPFQKRYLLGGPGSVRWRLKLTRYVYKMVDFPLLWWNYWRAGDVSGVSTPIDGINCTNLGTYC